MSYANIVRLARVGLVACCISASMAASPASAQPLQQEPWKILQTGLDEHRTANRAAAVGALGLLQENPRAVQCAEKALGDKKTAVRVAAARALGEMGARSSIPLLRLSLADKRTEVVSAASDSLISLGDPLGYQAYYDIVTGERKIGHGWIAEREKLIADPRAMVLVGIGVGIGYAPYAGYGWMLWRELSKDYATPVRMDALKKLATDPNPRSEGALVKAASDKRAEVREAALVAIAHRGDPGLIGQLMPHMVDKSATVRYTAAAAVLRLSAPVPSDGWEFTERQ
jgi:HEAT repeat protein